MRKVDDYFDDIPISLQSAQLTNTRYKRGQLSILQRILQDSRVKDSDYKGNGDVKTALLGIYSHCCAFCEARIGKYDDIKGRTSIQYYGLSDWEKRPLLIQDRQEIIENVRKRVYHSVDSYVNDERLYQDLLEIHIDLIRKIESRKPFSAVRRSCLVNFKRFFVDCFTGEQETILNRAYDRVKEDLS